MSKQTCFLPFPVAMLAVATVFGLQTNAQAVQVSYAAPLLGSNEVPAVVTSGSYDFAFDMTLASSYRPGFITSSGGTVSGAFNSLLAGLDAGKAYFNLHTSAFPGGELRGNLTPVPEPSTYAMLLAGLGLVGWAARARTSVRKA
jgi:hypothetical protein